MIVVTTGGKNKMRYSPVFIISLLSLLIIIPMFPGNLYTGSNTTVPLYSRVKEKSDYSVDVMLNLVDVIVLDEDGNHITDLTREDFELYQSGERKQIHSLNLVNHLAKIQKKESKKKKPQELKVRGARNFAFVVTNLPRYEKQKNEIIEGMIDFVEKDLGVNDKVALYNINQFRIEEILPFTDNRTKILKVMKEYKESGAYKRNTLYIDKDLLTYRDRQTDSEYRFGTLKGHAHDAADIMRANYRSVQQSRLNQTLNIIEMLAKSMRYIPGRKNIILVSQELTPPDTEDAGSESYHRRMKKLQTSFAVPEKLKNTLNANNTALYMLRVGADNYNPADPNSNEAIFASLSEETGGNYLASRTPTKNNIMRNLNNINYMTASYYELSYNPGQSPESGESFEIELNVKRENARLVYRKNLSIPESYDDMNSSERELYIYQAAYSTTEFNDLSLETDVRFFPGAGDKTRVLMSAQTRFEDIFHEDGSGKECELFALIRVENSNTGDVKKFSRNIEFALKEKAEILYENKLRHFEIAELDPGEYEIRFFFGDLQTGKLASDIFSIHVPTFSDNKHSISNLLLLDKEGQQTLPVSNFTPLPGGKKVEMTPGNPINFAGHPMIHLFPAAGKAGELDTVLVTVKGFSEKEIKNRAGNIIQWFVFDYKNGRLGKMKTAVNARVMKILPNSETDSVKLLYRLNLNKLPRGKYVLVAVIQEKSGEMLSSPMPLEIAMNRNRIYQLR